MSLSAEKTSERRGSVRRGFFTRAAAALLPATRGSRSESVSTQLTHNSSTAADGLTEKENNSATESTNTHTGDSMNDALLDDKDRRRYARTLPPWIHSLVEGDLDEETKPSSSLLLQQPLPTRPAKHHYVPEPNESAAKGRRFDHHRSREAVTITQPVVQHASKWRGFADSSAYARPEGEESEVVDDQWKKDNLPDLEAPWAPEGMADGHEMDKHLWLFSSDKRAATVRRYNRMLIKNPFVPLIIRLTVLAYVGAALGLGAWIYQDTKTLNTNPNLRAGTTPGTDTAGNYICEQQTSTYMAFIVDSCAVVYLLYITWDEYASKPLGLRSFRAKMRLIFLDLLFIVFSAANLSLAFNTLTDQQWACYADPASASISNNEAAALTTCVYNGQICERQQALCAMLLIALAAWLMTFAISVLRVVERIAR